MMAGDVHGRALRADILPLLIICAVAAILVQFTYVGYIESDDHLYAVAAQGWLNDFPYLPVTHWGLRHMMVLPVALSFALFGVNEFALTLPMAIYFVALVAMIYLAVARWHGSGLAIPAAAVVAITPLLVMNASTVYTDLVEAFWVIASFFCLLSAQGKDRRVGLLLAAGACAGAAWITRETTLAYLAYLGILFLFAPGMPRIGYVVMGIGFIAVAGLDMLLLWVASGDPIYRFTITMKGVAGDNPDMDAMFEKMQGFDRHGNLMMARWALPLGMLAVHQKFGVLYLLAIPLWIWLCFGRQVPDPVRRSARHLGAMSLVWFVILSYVLTKLWVQPRYQTVPTVAAAMVTGFAIAILWRTGRQVIATGVALATVASNALMLVLENRDIIFGERALVELAREQTEPVTTDTNTQYTARFLLQTAGLADRVRVGAPPTGGLYLVNSAPRRGNAPDRVAPQPGWTVVAKRQASEKPVGLLLRQLGILSRLPAGIAQKFAPPPKEAVLYRVP